VQSMNVSVAAAVILFEAQRQRQKAGFYDAVRLLPNQYQTLEYEWLYPREAEILRERGEKYPVLK
jgi:tRNA (guanosine-2'-O-)-methyltransferase